VKKIFVTIFIFLAITFLLSAQQTNSQKKNPPVKSALQPKVSPGEKLYNKYCRTCHQADAGGVPNLNPPLINTTYVLGDKERLIKIILLGLNEHIEIDDEYFSNPMPALNILKDQEIADVLTYVRNNFGNKASAITAAEVKVVRSKTK
jgi:mono/diheme cytochrome c family protein